MKRFLQDTCAAPYIQKKTKDAASGSSAALQDTCWKYFRGVERQASDSYWYLATFNFCAHAERLGDIAAESGRIPKGAFVRWAMQLLSVKVQRGYAEMYPPEWAGHLAGAGFALQCWLCIASADVVMRRVYGALLVAMLVL